MILRLKTTATFSISYMIIGMVLIVTGSYLASLATPLALGFGGLTALVGVLLFPGFKQTVLDDLQANAKVYLILGPFRILISRKPTGFAREVTLSLFRENQRMNYASLSSNVKTRSYDVALRGDGQTLILAETPNYHKALDTLEEVGQFMDLPRINQFEAMKASLQNGRRRRQNP